MIHGKIEFTGKTDGDVELAIEAALESIRRGNTRGFDRNDTGSYTFSLVDDDEDADDEDTVEDSVRFWVEPIGFGDGRYGPFEDEVEASGFIDGSEFVSDETHKIVPRPKDDRPFTKDEVRAEVMAQIPTDYSPSEIDEIVHVVLTGTYPTLKGSVDRAIQGLEA